MKNSFIEKIIWKSHVCYRKLLIFTKNRAKTVPKTAADAARAPKSTARGLGTEQGTGTVDHPGTHDFLVESREKFKSCLEFPWQSTDMQLVFKNVEALCGRFFIDYSKKFGEIQSSKKRSCLESLSLFFFDKKVSEIEIQTLF